MAKSARPRKKRSTHKVEVRFRPGTSQADLIKAPTGSRSYQGWIVYAGRVSDGTFNVQFNVASHGYASDWPEWAYEVALPALLHGKKVWVIAKGLPYGRNLLQVLALYQPA